MSLQYITLKVIVLLAVLVAVKLCKFANRKTKC